MNRKELIELLEKHRKSNIDCPVYDVIYVIIEHLIEQEHEAEFEYPLWRKVANGEHKGMVYKFTELLAGIPVTDTMGNKYIGDYSASVRPHEDDCWTPCEKPEPTPEPLEFTGEPVMAYVSNINSKQGYLEAVRIKRIRQVVSHGVCYTAIMSGKTNTKSGDICVWRYAWPVEGEKK